MCIDFIMITIHPNIKFSDNFVRGSSASREKLISQLNEKFFESFDVLIRSKNVTLKDVKKVYHNLLPEKINIDVKKFFNSASYEAAMDYKYDDDENIVGLTIELPIKNSKISEETLPTIMHENTHLLTTLANPKHTALTQKLYSQGKYGKTYDDWYSGVLYKEEKIDENYTKNDMKQSIIEATQKFLNGQNCKDKVYYLQDARYQLEQELFAYKEQLKFAKRLDKMGRKVKEDDLYDFDKYFFITEKIDILKIMLAEQIAKTRAKIAKRNKRKCDVNV